ncbi:MAG TPA: NAD(P)-binding protein, partial [Gemmatimonadales bacterium]
MKVHIVGGGPAGLYLAILMKRADPSHEVVVVERNRIDDTFGFGVVFSEATQENLAQADPESAREMTSSLATWDDIDIHYRGSVITSTGHGFAGIERRALLGILARRACDLKVDLRFSVEVTDPAALGSADLVVAADGMSSIVRDKYAAEFVPRLEWRPNRFVWLGTTRPFPAFTF